MASPPSVATSRTPRPRSPGHTDWSSSPSRATGYQRSSGSPTAASSRTSACRGSCLRKAGTGRSLTRSPEHAIWLTLGSQRTYPNARVRPRQVDKLSYVGLRSASEDRLVECRFRVEFDRVGSVAQSNVVGAFGDMPLAGISVEASQEPAVGAHGHLA